MKSSDVNSCAELKSEIKNRLNGKVSIVGLGNILRGDDGLGPKLIELLKSRGGLKASLFDCGTAPENYIFPILSTACDTVILVDAASLNIAPGAIKIFDLNEIANVSFSTHSPSPRLFTDLLMTGKDNLNIFIVSVQPKTTILGDPVSDEVLLELNVLADIFSETIN